MRTLILKSNERISFDYNVLNYINRFMIYFLVDFMHVLGSIEKLNPFIAGIGLTGICFLLDNT